MRGLWSNFFPPDPHHSQMISAEDARFLDKTRQLNRLSHEEFGIPAYMGAARPEIHFSWQSAVRRLVEIPEARTPRSKLLLVGLAIQILQNSFTLYMEGSQITADDIVTVLPYLFVKAQIPSLIA